MASALIHICVAKELNKRFNMNEKQLFLGSIAPDLAKQVGQTKNKGHFLDLNLKEDVPNINRFLEKYKGELNKPFELGYFIHLYTDKLWFDGFIDELVLNNNVKLMDGTIVIFPIDEIDKLIYNDYTNMNIELIEEYNLDLSLFYEEFDLPNTNITEIPVSKIKLLIDQMGLIVKNSNQDKKYIFDISSISRFIENCCNEIMDYLLEHEIIK